MNQEIVLNVRSSVHTSLVNSCNIVPDDCCNLAACNWMGKRFPDFAEFPRQDLVSCLLQQALRRKFRHNTARQDEAGLNSAFTDWLGHMTLNALAHNNFRQARFLAASHWPLSKTSPFAARFSKSNNDNSPSFQFKVV